MGVPRLHDQSVVVCQMNIPFSVIRAGDIIHCHTIVMVTGNPQCRIRFGESPEGCVHFVVLVWMQLHRDTVLLVPDRYR